MSDVLENVLIEVKKLEPKDGEVFIVQLQSLKMTSEEELLNTLLLLRNKLSESYPNIDFLYLPYDMKAYFNRVSADEIDNVIEQLREIKRGILGIIQ